MGVSELLIIFFFCIAVIALGCYGASVDETVPPKQIKSPRYFVYNELSTLKVETKEGLTPLGKLTAPWYPPETKEVGAYHIGLADRKGQPRILYSIRMDDPEFENKVQVAKDLAEDKCRLLNLCDEDFELDRRRYP